MSVYQGEFEIATRGNGHMHCIDEGVMAIIRSSKITNGTVHIFNVGSTACIGAVEFEPGLQKDVPEFLNRLIPPSRQYGHEQTWHDGNGHSHLQATLMGPDLTVPLSEGRMVLGTWQQVFHLECDNKPRQRRIVVTIQGE